MMKFRFPTFCYAAVSFCMIVLAGGCKEDIVTEGTPLVLSYATNTLTIAPDGEDYVIPAPEYEGYAPYRFAFTSITLDGSPYSDDTHFSIAADNGKITVTNTSTLEVGTYLLSVSCESNAVHYEWPDAVKVEVIKLLGDVVAVNIVAPEVSMRDDLLTADGDFLVAEASFTETREGAVLSIAHVINDRDEAHAIAWFRLSEDNKLYLKQETASEVEAGIYTVSLKVTDANGEEGIVPSFDITVTAEPYNLVYEPAVLETQERGPKVEAAASVKGNPNGLSFEFGSVQKKAEAENQPAEESLVGKLFTIDQETGTVAVDPTVMSESDSYAGEYIFNILVKNADSEDGVLFENVLSAVILEYQTPISGFSYETATIAIGKETIIEKAEGFIGGSPVFSFAEGTDQKYIDAIDLDSDTGTLTFKSGNILAGGSHSVTIVATNNSGSVEATFEFVVIDPTTFSYFTYGSNYVEAGSTEEAIAGKHTSHFRYDTDGTYTVSIQSSDISSAAGAVYALAERSGLTNKLNVKDVTINETTGELTFTTNFASANNRIGFIIVQATVGDKTVEHPVFINVPNSFTSENVKVLYTPFVCKVRPGSAGQVKSLPPAIEPAGTDVTLIDYKRNFTYYNIDGTYSAGNCSSGYTATYIGGEPLESGVMQNDQTTPSPIKHLFINAKKPGTNASGCNFGAKAGMSVTGNDDPEHAASVAAYIDPSDWSLVINPDRWVIEPYVKTVGGVEYTNTASGTFDGIFFAESEHKFNTMSSSTGQTNVCIWLDKDYEPEN